MSVGSTGNPNICRDCEVLTLDDSPQIIARQTETKDPGLSSRELPGTCEDDFHGALIKPLRSE